MANNNDFKLHVGLDTTGSLDQVKKDIRELEKLLKDTPLHVNASVQFNGKKIRQDFNAVIAGLNKSGALLTTIKPIITKTSVTEALENAIKPSNSHPRDIYLTPKLNAKNFQNDLDDAIRNLKTVPRVKIGVELDPDGLNNVMNRISKTLDIDLVPQTKSKYNIDAAKSEWQTALSNVEEMFRRFTGVTSAESKQISKEFKNIGQAIANAVTEQDIAIVEQRVSAISDTVESLQSKTKAGFNVQYLVEQYNKLSAIIKDAGEEETEYGKQILQTAKSLKDVQNTLSKKGEFEILKANTLSVLKNANEHVESLSQLCKVAFIPLRKDADITLKRLLNQLTQVDVTSGAVVDEIVALVYALKDVYSLSDQEFVTQAQADRIKDIHERMEAVELTAKRILLHRKATQQIEKQMEPTGRQISLSNKVDKIDTRLGDLDGVDQSMAARLREDMNLIRDAIAAASSAADFDEVAKQIQLIDNAITKLEKNTFDDKYRNKILETIEQYQELLSIVQQAGDQDGWEHRLQNIVQLLADVFKYGDNHVFADDEIIEINRVVDGLENTKDALDKIYQKAPTSKSKILDIDKAEKEIAKLEKAKESLRKLGFVDTSEVKEIDELIDKLKEMMREGGILQKNARGAADIVEVEKTVRDLQKLYASIDRIKREMGAEFFDISQIHKFEKIKQDLERYVSDNKKLLSNDELKSTYEYLRKMTYFDYGANKAGVEKYAAAFDRFKATVKGADLEAKTLNQTVKELFAGITLSGIVSRLGDRLLDVFRDAVDNVKTLDAAMTELKKVTDESSASYDRFMQNAKKQAQEVGATLSDVIYSTADFARLGYSVEEATELSRVSTIYKNVGDGFDSVTESSEALISIMKAFGVETENVITIADKLNNIGNKNAISSGGLGRALQTSASALMEAGASMEEAMALVTGANGVIQDPSQVGKNRPLPTIKTTITVNIQRWTRPWKDAS